MPTLTYYVTTGADDGHYNSFLGVRSANEDDIIVGYYFFSQGTTGFMRFLNIDIPINSHITAATLHVYITGTDGTGVKYKAHLCDSRNATVIPTTTAEFDALPLTTTYTQYNDVAPTLNEWTTIDLTAQLQQVICKGGWAPGNAILVLLKGEFYSSGTDNCIYICRWENSTNTSYITIDYTEPADEVLKPPYFAYPNNIPRITRGALTQSAYWNIESVAWDAFFATESLNKPMLAISQIGNTVHLSWY